MSPWGGGERRTAPRPAATAVLSSGGRAARPSAGRGPQSGTSLSTRTWTRAADPAPEPSRGRATPRLASHQARPTPARWASEPHSLHTVRETMEDLRYPIGRFHFPRRPRRGTTTNQKDPAECPLVPRGTPPDPSGFLAGLRRILLVGRGLARLAEACVDCPLRAECTQAAVGRTIQVGPYEKPLAEARQRQQDPDWAADYRATRPKVERKIERRKPRQPSRISFSPKSLSARIRRSWQSWINLFEAMIGLDSSVYFLLIT